MIKVSTETNQVAVILGGGPGISASCARHFVDNGMQVAIAARNIEKPILKELHTTHGVHLFTCDASVAEEVESLFKSVAKELGTPKLVVHNIDGRFDGIFRKTIVEADPALAFDVIRNAAFSALLVGQNAARHMLESEADENGTKGTLIFTNASAALKGFPMSAAFAMSCHAKTGLAESMARELMPKGIHVANVPIDAAVGVPQKDGTRVHRLAGETSNDNMAHPDRIAELYLQLHRQHRSTWAFEIAVRPWSESW